MPGRDPGPAVAPGRARGFSPSTPLAGGVAPTGTAVPKAVPPVQPPLSASLTALPTVNLAALDAAIVIRAPVWGLRP